MGSSPHLFNKDARLASLAEYDLLSGNDDVDLTEIVELAARMFDVSIMMVSLIERDTLTFKARAGIKACGADRNGSSCAHAIAQQNIFVVPDATLDARFENHPLVLGAPFIRLYAGGPLRFHRAADRLALHHGQPAS